ncbi:DegT/DnrJ/EryC1/StrS family aminotransferase [Micromonospora sp. BRA006-A]|uniref:DegT/DnrJ/EryC1/StrS family aminotransferase n=1 Tax=Micromonospora sp. BRA006-A TaxID=2962860 RepID=UPI00296FEEFE|nr:DegT/DnrJ/EryC1/StrS family aminotransferase [Micromonospora sp. BRA006-A]MDW3848662.1 DegT/DnrJ/EryC1/StrS family aminotransferase [Micromonospora sp. BRA006-A]
MIPLFRVPMSVQAPGAVAEVVASGQVGQGARVARFEAELAARIGNPRVATVSSATAGLHLALRLATDGEPGGEVLSTPMTMEATNWTILANGLDIRWVDVDPATLNVDLDDLAGKITRNTRVIMVVHFAGYPVDLDRLRAVLDRAEAEHGVRPVVIEDCAHAWGATYRGVPLGNQGNVSVFSFQAVKHLTCGDGGLITLADDESHRRATLLRWFGIDRSVDRLRTPPDVTEWGYKFHMTDINAAIGLANLAYSDEVVARHRANAAYYDSRLAGVAGVELTERRDDRESSFWIYPLKVADRAGFVRRMTEAGITVSQVHARNDAHTCVRKYAAPLPGVDDVDRRLVCVPVGWWVGDEDREKIADTIRAGW